MARDWTIRLYLVVIKFTVLEVGSRGDRANAGVGVIVGVLTHTVRETFLHTHTHTNIFKMRHVTSDTIIITTTVTHNPKI